MASPVTFHATNPAAAATSSGTTGSGLAAISKDQFLQLLVTQLKHQDPMSPMEPNEFAAQLAQFSSVEQLVQLNDAVASQSDAIQMSTLAGQAALGASMIGRQVVAEGNQVSIPASGHGSVRIDVGAGGGPATLTLKDANGAVVATKDLGVLPAGNQTVQLPADLPAGVYSYDVAVQGPGATKVSVLTYTTGVVDAVEFDRGRITLRLGGLKVLLGNVAEVDPAPAANTP